MEKFFKQKFPDLAAGLYVNKQKMCVHMGLEKSIYSYSNYKEIIEECEKFFEEHLSNKFIVTKLQLIHNSQVEIRLYNFLEEKK